ncbi:unnamed protein product [Hymenolepis diminuta]|uniref:DUF5732 domain-containing protein n=1 Tax=Hymenolepis diminuta TaxID=6216 RepID=A0A0R3SY95_HYMDI|nr:unnamed protein product [Hymenolepis diminuta]VUZ56098.1 unnamed protein product [Hymenolepis diminuta]
MCSERHVSAFSTNTNPGTIPLSTQNPNIHYTMPVFPIMYSTIPTSRQEPRFHPIVPSPTSASISNIQRTSVQLSELERNRKDKKKYLERLRRAKINNQTKAMYDLVFKMSDETIRKTEICEMLGDCLTVIESFYKNVMEDPILKARVLPPGLLSNFPEVNDRTQDPAFHTSREDKENIPTNSNVYAFSLKPSSIQGTSTPVECRKRKRESVDSGLDQSQRSTSSILNFSSLLASETPPPPKTFRISPDPKIWRPYQE